MESGSAYTDASGAYTIVGLPAGDYKVRLSELFPYGGDPATAASGTTTSQIMRRRRISGTDGAHYRRGRRHLGPDGEKSQGSLPAREEAAFTAEVTACPLDRFIAGRD